MFGPILGSVPFESGSVVTATPSVGGVRGAAYAERTKCRTARQRANQRDLRPWLRCPRAARCYLPAGRDAELRGDLAQVPFDGVRADEELRADLGVRQPVTGQARDLRFLGGESGARLDGALAYRLAGGLELAPGAFRERLDPHVAEHLVRDAQLLACVEAAVLPAQPLAVEQPGAGVRHPDPGAAEPLDRLAVLSFGGRSVTHLGTYGRRHAEGVVRAIGLCKLAESPGHFAATRAPSPRPPRRRAARPGEHHRAPAPRTDVPLRRADRRPRRAGGTARRRRRLLGRSTRRDRRAGGRLPAPRPRRAALAGRSPRVRRPSGRTASR